MARHKYFNPRPRFATPDSTSEDRFPSLSPPSPPFLTPTRDCFSFLPHEIIQTILDMANDENLALPLSNRSLLPFYRAELYREVEISSTHQLDLFTRTLASNPALAKYIVTLKIHNSRSHSVVGWNRSTVVLNSTQLRAAFESLLDCSSISIIGPSEVIAAFLAASGKWKSSSCLALDLEGDFSEVDDPFDIAHYKSFSALRMLMINVLRSPQVFTPKEASAEHQPDAYFPSVEILDLAGPLTSYFSTYRLLPRFSPTALRLADSSQLLPLPSLLAFLPKPEFTKVVSLSGSDPYCSFARALRPFNLLLSLTFESYSASLKDAFYSALRKLPIKRLYFERDCTLDIELLTDLLHGQSKHQTLRHLHVEVEPAVEGSYIKIEDEDEWHTDWKVPQVNYAGYLSEEYRKTKRLVRRAKQGGVKIGGNVIETLEVQAKWATRFDRAQDRYADGLGSEDQDNGEIDWD